MLLIHLRLELAIAGIRHPRIYFLADTFFTVISVRCARTSRCYSIAGIAGLKSLSAACVVHPGCHGAAQNHNPHRVWSGFNVRLPVSCGCAVHGWRKVVQVRSHLVCRLDAALTYDAAYNIVSYEYRHTTSWCLLWAIGRMDPHYRAMCGVALCQVRSVNPTCITFCSRFPRVEYVVDYTGTHKRTSRCARAQ